ncbi:MAG: glycosyltransferase family 2 protein [Verrucomicrobia bacterium]|nr:glycosyltransferase family 2 protein [Verrucomicrobiota bacterium]
MSNIDLSIVLPAYNEGENIRPFYDVLKKVLLQELPAFQHEIIFVNDGSKDNTWEAISDLIKTDDRVRGIRFSRNFGHQAALTAGMNAARGKAVVTMDCDLQDPSSLIPEMVKKWQAGAKIVYARRISRHDRPFKRWTADLYYRLLAKSTEFNLPRDVGDFRLMDRVALNSLLDLDEHARYLRGMVAWLGFRHDFADFDRPERIHGETNYTFRKMTHLAMDGILSFTFLPLRVGVWIGMLSILVSGLFFSYMIVDSIFFHQEYPLYKWLVVLLLAFVGLQFMFLWILGEYIGRIYNDVRKRPLYVIEERAGDFAGAPPGQ